MKKLSALILTLLLANNCYAVAPDIRISDNNGNVMALNSDGSLKATTSGWTGGHVTNCAATDSTTLQACITAASAGDTIQLISGTINITTGVTISTAGITLRGVTDGALAGGGTLISSTSTTALKMITVTADNVNIENLTIRHAATMASGNTVDGIYIDGTSGTVLSNVTMRNVFVSLAGTDAGITRTGVTYLDAGGKMFNVNISVTNTANSTTIGMLFQGNSTQEATTSLISQQCTISANGSGAAGTTRNVAVFHNANNTPNTSTLTMYAGSIGSVASASSKDYAIESLNTAQNKNSEYILFSTLNGLDADFIITGGVSVSVLYSTDLIHNTASGTNVTYSGTFVTSKLKATFTAAAGADTACNTTCGTANCVAGYDITTTALVDCASAAADSCICS